MKKILHIYFKQDVQGFAARGNFSHEQCEITRTPKTGDFICRFRELPDRVIKVPSSNVRNWIESTQEEKEGE